MKCFICSKEIYYRFVSRHLLKCSKEHNIDSDKKLLKYKQICFTYNLDIEEFRKLYSEENYSFPELKKKYGFSYKIIDFLIGYLSLKKRDLKTARCSQKTKEKIKKTCIEKYGAENPLSRNTEPYKNRNKTVKEKYGVNNVFQIRRIIDSISQIMIEKYGQKRITDPEKIRKARNNFSEEKWKIIYNKFINTIKKRAPQRHKEIVENRRKAWFRWWEKLTDEAKNKYLYRLWKKTEIETKIENVLKKFSITYTYSPFINKRQYDFKIGQILIEVQGDFWHANPLLYKETDILNFPGKKVTAGELWKKDIYKKENAKKYGYKIIYIWEREINSLSQEELELEVLERIRKCLLLE